MRKITMRSGFVNLLTDEEYAEFQASSEPLFRVPRLGEGRVILRKLVASDEEVPTPV